MTTLVIEPRDTLVLGDGKRVGEPGAHRSLDIPWPSTFAGTLRTEAGRESPTGRFVADPAEVVGWRVRGPLLVELAADGTVARTLYPAPADAVLFEQPDGESGALMLRALSPGTERFPSDLPEDLSPLGFAGREVLTKPSSSAPRYWSEKTMMRWLLDARDDDAWRDGKALSATGRQARVSVALSPETATGQDGALFEVEHVVWREGIERRFGVLGEIDRVLAARVVGMGGERRLSFLRPTNKPLPTPPAGLLDALRRSRRARLVLATPGIFDGGYRPSEIPGARLVAASVGRPLVVSGWDWKARGPKVARRCAPAGSVYFVELAESTDPEAWLSERWLQSLSTDLQDQRDGFGLALVGAAE